MRVLHVLEELAPSGAERMLELAGPLWGVHDVNCQILSKGDSPGVFARRLVAAGYEVHHLPTTPQHTYPARLFRFLRRHRVHVLHNHSEHANFWTATAARAAGVPVLVRTIHNNFQFTGRLRTERIVQRRLLRTIGVQTVAVGESVRRNEQERFHNPARLVENWYDADAFTPASPAQHNHARAALGIQGDGPVVALVGNCDPIKDHPRMLRAMADPALANLVCLHAGREDDMKYEQRLASELGVSDRCQFLGPDADVATVLQAADVFVMPSIYEGSSIAALEALSTGMPVVLATAPGLIDLEALDAGIEWVDPGSSLAAAVRLALQHRGRARRQEIHRSVAQRHGPARGVAEYAKVYRDAMR